MKWVRPRIPHIICLGEFLKYNSLIELRAPYTYILLLLLIVMENEFLIDAYYVNE